RKAACGHGRRQSDVWNGYWATEVRSGQKFRPWIRIRSGRTSPGAAAGLVEGALVASAAVLAYVTMSIRLVPRPEARNDARDRSSPVRNPPIATAAKR